MNEYQPDLLSVERFGRRLRDVLSRSWGSIPATRSSASRTDPRTGAPAATSAPVTSRLWYVADGSKAPAQTVAVRDGRTLVTSPGEPVVPVDPVAEHDEDGDRRGCAESERLAAQALVAAVSGVFGLDPDAFPEDTVVMPVVGDRVFYGHGSGHLVGLEGVVVRDDAEPDLPPGLRYVQFDEEAWPNVVTVTALERL